MSNQKTLIDMILSFNKTTNQVTEESTKPNWNSLDKSRVKDAEEAFGIRFSIQDCNNDAKVKDLRVLLS